MTLYRLGDATPKVDPSTWIAPGAQVIGKADLGADVGVWFGAVLRGDNELIAVGEGTNLQEHVMCHTDPGYPITIGVGCTIGHKAMIHGCTVEDGALVGMSATILNGAKIGAQSLIGAGALITEGREIPPRSLVVGAPGKVVRTLSDDEVAGQAATASRYVDKIALFRDQMVEL